MESAQRTFLSQTLIVSVSSLPVLGRTGSQEPQPPSPYPLLRAGGKLSSCTGGFTKASFRPSLSPLSGYQTWFSLPCSMAPPLPVVFVSPCALDLYSLEHPRLTLRASLPQQSASVQETPPGLSVMPE